MKRLFQHRLFRYGLAVAGPVASAGSQFLLSLVFLRLLSPHLFGSLSFLLVASVLSWSLWSALFCAPLPPLLHRTQPGEAQKALIDCLFSANLLLAMVATIPFFLIATAVSLPLFPALLYAAYGMIALLRWFARAYTYATGGQIRSVLSDMAYSIVLLCGIGVAWLVPHQALAIAYATLALSAFIGLLPFGTDYLRQQFVHFRPSALARYGRIWRDYSGWSLVGVLTTEMTANSHAYLVTGLFGPAAFAPIAASALMIRPINVAMNALSDFERAQMARHIGEGRPETAARSVHLFRLVLGLVWGATLVLVLALLHYAPRLIFPPIYPLSFLMAGAALWMGVSAIRLCRTPESALLQAAGHFRPLALASVISAGVSVPAVLIALYLGGTLWSIAGIGVGEFIYALWIFQQARRWRHGAVQMDAAPVTPATSGRRKRI